MIGSSNGHIELHLSRRPSIETKDDYVKVNKSAVRSGFKVVELNQDQFLDFAALQNSITKRKSKEMNFQDSRVIAFDTRAPKNGVVQWRCNFSKSR